MSFGIWNKIKNGFRKVKSKVIPIINKSINYLQNNDIIKNNLPIYNAYYPNDEDENYETIGMIQPRFK